jgi:hypothetical protein
MDIVISTIFTEDFALGSAVAAFILFLAYKILQEI